jgi:putative sterol carrier protein
MATFPTDPWLQSLIEKLNSDEHYAQVARNWEGDMLVIIEPGASQTPEYKWYLDLWHGKCRDAYAVEDIKSLKPSVTLRASADVYQRIFKGELDVLQALWTRKVGVQGNMALIMRSVPTVLDFVRCCREITDSYV